MSFTTPCFIRKNTPELRNKLEGMGYTNCTIESGLFLFTSRGIFDSMHIEIGLSDLARNGLIDCGANEPLFLAIAALRDDTSIGQYWVFDEDLENHKKGDFVMGAFYRCSCHCHVATIPELIEHFKAEE